TEVPLNMGGEITERKVVTRHLFWGTVLVLAGYFIATFALLVVQGSSVGSVGGFSLITNVDMVLGKGFGNITVVCMLVFFVIVPVVYNCTFARLLMVAGIDRRLPGSIGRLNKNRVPANAIIFTLLIFDVAPYIVNLGKPADLANEVFNVSQAGATLVWAISSAFFFINIAVFYRRDRNAFDRQRIFPKPVLFISMLLGPLACLLSIVDTLFFSWIPQIDNGHWWYIVGGLTIVCLVVATVGSMVASSEASWESLESSTK
ncbi:MAG TPA: hypothetical protein VGU68_08540, partial [Ktedonobacteraceae bacterium]|nr:hypothetical protein [Ktedonobacteraceae bacterium]